MIATNEKSGYGLISKIDPATGDLIEHKTFVSNSCASGFNDIVFNAGAFYCTGYTNDFIYTTENPLFRGWFANIDGF